MVAGVIWMLAAYRQAKENQIGMMAMNIAVGALNIAVGAMSYATSY